MGHALVLRATSESRPGAGLAPAADDEYERRVRLLLLSKGAVLAHWFHSPLAAGMDESEQSPGARGANVLGCSFRTDAGVRPVRGSRSLWNVIEGGLPEAA